MENQKQYIIDTNVLLEDPNALSNFVMEMRIRFSFPTMFC
jgi:predicted ribonuclease YlaK